MPAWRWAAGCMWEPQDAAEPLGCRRPRRSRRRHRICRLSVVEVAVQTVNLAFFVAPNAYALSTDCTQWSTLTHVSGFFRWTCWASVGGACLTNTWDAGAGRVLGPASTPVQRPLAPLPPRSS